MASVSNFQTTHWSLLDMAKSDSPRKDEALDRICRTYWKPVYAFVRKMGRSPEEAEDLTQGFFAYAIGRNFFESVDRAKGSLRGYLKQAVKFYGKNEYRNSGTAKRGGNITFVYINARDAETDLEFEPVCKDRTPEEVFDMTWALEILKKCLNEMQKDYIERGNGKLFEELSTLLCGSQKGDLSDLARRFNTTEGAMRMAYLRFRERFRDTVKAEIRQTVSCSQSIEDELESFLSVLTGISK